jgi:signal peptidase I
MATNRRSSGLAKERTRRGRAGGRPRPPEHTTPGARRRAAPKSGPLEFIKSLAIAFGLFLLIRQFLLQAFPVPSSSMENSLLIGDYLMANKAIYGSPIPLTGLRVPAFREPRHSDIVIFRPEYNDPVMDVVKRVIALPGDTVQMVEQAVFLNGAPLPEPYAVQRGYPDLPMDRSGPLGGACCYDWHLDHLPAGVDRETYRPSRDSWGPLIVPEGSFLLLGDNREESLDSRYAGFIPRDVIRGRALFIYFSYDPDPRRPFPRAITGARWGRIGHIIR